MIRRILSITIAMLSIAACSPEIDEPEIDGLDDDDQFRVFDGEPATSDIDKYAATVALHQRSGNMVSKKPVCSGTLIHPRVVMTAAHCCDESQFGPKFDPIEAEQAAVYFGSGPAFIDDAVNGEFRTLSEVQIHPAYDGFSLANDLCLLRLTKPKRGTPTVPHLPASRGLGDGDAGVLLDYVGFGFSDVAKTQHGLKLHTELPLAGLGCVVPGCKDPGTKAQFSHRQDGDSNLGACNGDSGGPVFISRNNRDYVAGVISHGDFACMLYGVSTNVSAYQTFIDEFIEADDGGPSPHSPAVANFYSGYSG